MVIRVPDLPLARSEPGASIAINGCCLTVVERAEGEAIAVAFDVMGETVSHTTMSGLEVGEAVNVECALRMGDPLGGHWLQGHVDGVGTVVDVAVGNGSLDVLVEVPEAVARHCVDRGSIAIDGVSLTVMSIDGTTVAVSLVPETRDRTTLGGLRVGMHANLEADVLAKYVERLLARETAR